MRFSKDTLLSLFKYDNVKKLFKWSIFLIAVCIVLSILVNFYVSYSRTHPKVVSSTDVNSDYIFNRLALAELWYLRNSDPTTGNALLSYDTSQEVKTDITDIDAQLNALIVFNRLSSITHNNNIHSRTQAYITKLLTYIEEQNTSLYIKFNNRAYLNINALLIQLLINSDFSNRDYYIERLAHTLLSAQHDDGSYTLDLLRPSYKGETAMASMPGEIMTSLLITYNYTKNPIYLDSVRKAFPYYQKYWYDNGSILTASRYIPTFVLLYKATNDLAVYKTIVAMSTFIMDNQVSDASNVYQNGHFQNRDGRPSSVYVESLNHVYPILMDPALKSRCADVIKSGTLNFLYAQYIERSVFDTNENFMLGAFRVHLGKTAVHLNYTVHAVNSMLRTLDNNVF